MTTKKMTRQEEPDFYADPDNQTPQGPARRRTSKLSELVPVRLGIRDNLQSASTCPVADDALSAERPPTETARIASLIGLSDGQSCGGRPLSASARQAQPCCRLTASNTAARFGPWPAAAAAFRVRNTDSNRSVSTPLVRPNSVIA